MYLTQQRLLGFEHWSLNIAINEKLLYQVQQGMKLLHTITPLCAKDLRL